MLKKILTLTAAAQVILILGVVASFAGTPSVEKTTGQIIMHTHVVADVTGASSANTGVNKVTKSNGSALVDSGIYENGGNVGIGTTAPTVPLDVVGNALITGSASITGTVSAGSTLTAGGLVVNGTGTHNVEFTGTSTYADGNGTNHVKVGTDSGAGLAQLDVDGTVHAAKRVGIGTNAPAALLSVKGDGATMPLAVSSSAGTTGDYITVTSAGLVGIGSTSPSAKLNVIGAGTTSSTMALSVRNASASPLITVLDNGNVGIGSTSPHAGLVVTTSGNSGIGTSAPACMFDVGGGALGTGVVLASNSQRVAGDLEVDGVLYGKATSFGFRIVSAANTACTTTCVRGCLVGQNTANYAIVDCADATADVCYCSK